MNYLLVSDINALDKIETIQYQLERYNHKGIVLNMDKIVEYCNLLESEKGVCNPEDLFDSFFDMRSILKENEIVGIIFITNERLKTLNSLFSNVLQTVKQINSDAHFYSFQSFDRDCTDKVKENIQTELDGVFRDLSNKDIVICKNVGMTQKYTSKEVKVQLKRFSVSVIVFCVIFISLSFLFKQMGVALKKENIYVELKEKNILSAVTITESEESSILLEDYLNMDSYNIFKRDIPDGFIEDWIPFRIENKFEYNNKVYFLVYNSDFVGEYFEIPVDILVYNKYVIGDFINLNCCVSSIENENLVLFLKN